MVVLARGPRHHHAGGRGPRGPGRMLPRGRATWCTTPGRSCSTPAAPRWWPGCRCARCSTTGWRQKFVPADATWEATEDRNTPWAVPDQPPPQDGRYVFRTAEDVESGHGLAGCPRGWASTWPPGSWGPPWSATTPSCGRSPRSDRQPPAGATCAAVLCSGSLPTLVDDDFSLNYGDVSEEFASVLVAKPLG
ncbi:hypothetical protein QJS66_08920 [Kocuria rhizophila]|nr:hypothetical protein QJS66_08920 [Kocuria rhizophila]